MLYLSAFHTKRVKRNTQNKIIVLSKPKKKKKKKKDWPELGDLIAHNIDIKDYRKTCGRRFV